MWRLALPLVGAFLPSLRPSLHAAVVDPWYRLDRAGTPPRVDLSPSLSAKLLPLWQRESRHLADPFNVSVSTALMVFDHLTVVPCLARLRSTLTWTLRPRTNTSVSNDASGSFVGPSPTLVDISALAHILMIEHDLILLVSIYTGSLFSHLTPP